MMKKKSKMATPMVKGRVVRSSASNRKPKTGTKRGKTAY
jgi:hypothetical protein